MRLGSTSPALSSAAFTRTAAHIAAAAFDAPVTAATAAALIPTASSTVALTLCKSLPCSSSQLLRTLAGLATSFFGGHPLILTKPTSLSAQSEYALTVCWTTRIHPSKSRDALVCWNIFWVLRVELFPTAAMSLARQSACSSGSATRFMMHEARYRDGDHARL